MISYKKLLLFLFLFLPVTRGYAKTTTEIYDLTAEYKFNPLGIGEEHPRLSWKIKSTGRNVVQLSYRIKAAADEQDLKAGRNLLWDTGVKESDQSILVSYNGASLKSRQRVYWQVTVNTNVGKARSQPAFFEMGLLSSSDWEADWIRATFPDEREPDAIPYLRNEFKLDKKIKRARLYASAIGVYTVQINGERVGNEYLTPYWTSYSHRIQYQAYDVTDMLQQGENAVGMLLGNGWSRQFRSVRTNNASDNYNNFLAGIVQIEIEFDDGTRNIIKTDQSWKAGRGALLTSTIYNGEILDAEKEQEGWDKPGFDDSSWEEAIVVVHPKNILVSTEGEPVVCNEEIQPVKMYKNATGNVIVDMGQNMVGWLRLKVNGKRGDVINIRHAEVLDESGELYTANLRAAEQRMTYILKGKGEEVLEPKFSFQGFRYAEIEGLSELPGPDGITGVVIYSKMPIIGTFECSDSLINRLQRNILWGQKGNFVDVPTDCPQRDERLGWTGDAQVFASTACFNMYTPAFFTKWLQDLAADQHESGAVTYTVPNVHGKSGGAAGWADAALIVPWNLYQYYGDKRILERQYGSMKAWVEFIRSESTGYLWLPKNRQFGDWLSFSSDLSDYPGAYTEKDLICTAYFAYSAGKLSDIAEVLGYRDDAEEYALLFENIKKAYVNEFVTPAGRISSATQTAYVLSLYFELLPDDLVPEAAGRLAEDVRRFGHITTGFLGTNLICHVLSDNGYSDEAYMLLTRKEYPSWLYPVTKGATTIWERWDGIKPDGSFQDPSMNSFNHYAYGAVGDWLYRTVAGLNPQSAGYKRIKIKFERGGGLSYAKAGHESMYGYIESGWKVEGDKLHVDVTIPPNTTAELYIPSPANQITESGKKLADIRYLQKIKEKGAYTVIEAGSGSYRFENQLMSER